MPDTGAPLQAYFIYYDDYSLVVNNRHSIEHVVKFKMASQRARNRG